MISKILDLLFFIASWILLGMGLALFFYDCDKGSDMWHYIGASVLCFSISCMFCFTRKDKSE